MWRGFAIPRHPLTLAIRDLWRKLEILWRNYRSSGEWRIASNRENTVVEQELGEGEQVLFKRNKVVGRKCNFVSVPTRERHLANKIEPNCLLQNSRDMHNQIPSYFPGKQSNKALSRMSNNRWGRLPIPAEQQGKSRGIRA